jgi:hypothetical protein
MLHDVVEKAEQFQNFSIKKCNAHYLAAEVNGRKNLRLGIPVTVLTAAVATSIFGTLAQEQRTVWVAILTGALSVLATILSALQTFLRYSELSQTHRIAAVAYEGVRRKLDLFILKYKALDDRQAALEELSQISAELDGVADKAPTLPDAIYDAVKWRPASHRSYSSPEPSTASTTPAG